MTFYETVNFDIAAKRRKKRKSEVSLSVISIGCEIEIQEIGLFTGPSKPKKGQKAVPLPAQVAIKLAIYQGMRDQGITQAALGECLGVDGRQVRRILDLDHNTSLSQLVRALKCLGKELVIDIRNAAINLG